MLNAVGIFFSYQISYSVTIANRHVSTATNQHKTMEVLLEMVFSTVIHAKELEVGQSKD
jgi:hypothetical protein